MDKPISLPIFATTGFLTFTVLCVATPQGRTPVSDAAGKAVVQKMCVGCHSLNVVTSKRATPDQWSAVVQQMVSRGAEGTDEQIDTVVRYLSDNYGPQSPRAGASTAPSSQTLSPGAPTVFRPAVSADTSLQPSTIKTDDSDRPTVHVNVNRAGVKELAAVLSLTEKEAQTLIVYRQKNGKFTDWQEVAEVPGVPAGTIQDLHNRIVF
jgi:competence ComEA-like helix-hairpin-helix protein